MKWSRNEINHLLPILEQLSSDLAPVDGKNILVLCSATGEVAFWLAELMEQGSVIGLELDTGISRHCPSCNLRDGAGRCGEIPACRKTTHPHA